MQNDSRNATPKLLYRSLLLMGVSQSDIHGMESVFAAKLMACPSMTTGAVVFLLFVYIHVCVCVFDSIVLCVCICVESNLIAMEELADESKKLKFPFSFRKN